MSHFVIGDVQGCFNQLDELLTRINFAVTILALAKRPGPLRESCPDILLAAIDKWQRFFSNPLHKIFY